LLKVDHNHFRTNSDINNHILSITVNFNGRGEVEREFSLEDLLFLNTDPAAEFQ
jgi:hypothetical protein